tara:strand:- start:34944 stop:35393 length:450 start_codon:yes stop_codon:yes gene_type:complete
MTSTSRYDFTSAVEEHLGKAGYMEFFIPVDPVPASRPRVSKWGTYYGKTYENFRTKVRAALRDLTNLSGEPMTGPIHCLIEIVAPKPKTTKRDYPRGDVDNFAKGPLDSMTSHGGFWNDDDQVTALAVTKRYAESGEPTGVRIIYQEIV